MFRNVFRSPSTTAMLARAATAAFTGSSYISSTSNDNNNTRCDSKPTDVPTFKVWRKRSDGTENFSI